MRAAPAKQAQASFQYDNEFPAAAQDASDAAGDRDREP